jgi:hypothetical protein
MGTTFERMIQSRWSGEFDDLPGGQPPDLRRTFSAPEIRTVHRLPRNAGLRARVDRGA